MTKDEQKILMEKMEEAYDYFTDLSVYFHKNVNKKSPKHVQEARDSYQLGLDLVTDAYRLIMRENI